MIVNHDLILLEQPNMIVRLRGSSINYNNKMAATVMDVCTKSLVNTSIFCYLYLGK